MAIIGTATLNITPKFPGISSAITNAVSSVNISSAGTKSGSTYSSAFGTGITKSGAIIGAVSTVVSKATDAITQSLGDAISRFDTLNNYPKVMENLGYSSKDVSKSLETMDTRLQGLPTSLSDMVSTVQGIVTTTGDLDQATNAGIALNDMLLASGSSTQVTNAAMEQFRQILSKGKPEMQDWKSLTAAMPGQMDQLAKHMLGPTANANDLYEALGGGGAEATITTNDLLNAMIELDQNGGENITSFSEQAQSATDGVATSMANVQTAITRGLANTLDAIGKENIAGAFSGLKEGIDNAFSFFNGTLSAAMPTIKNVISTIGQLAPQIVTAIAAFKGFSIVKGLVSGAATQIATLQRAFSLASTGVTTLTRSFKLAGLGFSPLSLAITGIATAASFAVSAFMDWKTKTDNATKATQGLDDAMARATGVDKYSGKINGVGSSAETTIKSIDDLNAATADMVDTWNERSEKAEAEIGTLNAAQQYIDEYAGKTDLSTEAQGKLAWAIDEVNEQLGTTITASDVAKNCYTDQNGEVVNLKDSIYDLIEAKKQQIKMDMLQEDYKDALQLEKDAANAYANARVGYDDQYEYEKSKAIAEGYNESSASAIAKGKTDKWLEDYKTKASEATDKVRGLESAMGDLAKTGSEAGSELDKWAGSFSATTEAILNKAVNGDDGIAKFKSAISDLGVSMDDLKNLDDGQIETLATKFDGSTASVGRALEDMGIRVKNTGTVVSDNFNKIKDTLSNNEEIKGTFDDLGINIDDFAQKCADAGLRAEDFTDMSAEDFKKLYDSSKQNIDSTIATMALFNSAPLVNKDGSVNIDTNELISAEGHLMTYDGMGLYDKTAGTYVDSSEVVDATGNVWIWDGTQLVSKGADATITGNAVDGNTAGVLSGSNDAIQNLTSKDVAASVNGNAADGSAASNIWDTVRAIGNLGGSAVSGIVSFFSGNAAGGIRLNAKGGYRYHANGAIATRAVPLDIVGEDGAEAIVPLTNRKYSQPFVDLITQGIKNKVGATVNNYYTVNNLDYLPDSEVAGAVENLFSALANTRKMVGRTVMA